MKIRLTGTPADVERAAPVLAEAFDLVDQSQPYPCRAPSRLVRVYLDVRPRGTGGVR